MSDADLAALREATREAHETIKDLRAATQEARAVVKEVQRVAAEQVDERISAALTAGLDQLADSIKTACDDATTSVFARFDTITDTLLGETKKDRRAGVPSIPELLKDRRPS